MAHKLVHALRDPVHGYIMFSAAEKIMIDSPIVQRLRNIQQLTAVSYVYPGGTHTRFSHSIGAMHIAGMFARQLVDTIDSKLGLHALDADYFVRLARMAALLHDIGHGPFSHAFDRIVYSKIYNVPDGGHDEHRHVLIDDPTTALLIESVGIRVADLHAVWRADAKTADPYRVIKAIVGGPLGADRVDFIQRDAYFTGTSHFGLVATQRICMSMGMTHDYRLHYNAKVLPDIVQALEGRRYMYSNVYLHRKCEAASLLVERLLEEFHARFDLSQYVFDTKKFLCCTDALIIGQALGDSPLSDLHKICMQYMCRELPRTVKRTLCDVADDDDTPVSPVQKVTRAISGIDPKKFDQYGIYFLTVDGMLRTCADALADAHIGSMPPFKIVHEYE